MKNLHDNDDYQYLTEELKKAEDAYAVAQNQFSYLTDPYAVDACIYQMQTAKCRMDHMLHRLKAYQESTQSKHTPRFR